MCDKILGTSCSKRPLVSSVNIVAILLLYNRGIEFRFRAGARDFPLLYSAPIGSGVTQSPMKSVTQTISGDKAAGACS
jgi:hypothetical protein